MVAGDAGASAAARVHLSVVVSSGGSGSDGGLAALRAMAKEMREMESAWAAERAVLLESIKRKEDAIWRLVNEQTTSGAGGGAGKPPVAKAGGRKPAGGVPAPSKKSPSKVSALALSASPPLPRAGAKVRPKAAAVSAAVPLPPSPPLSRFKAAGGAKVSSLKSVNGGLDGAAADAANAIEDAAAQAPPPPPPPPRLGHRERPEQVPALNLSSAMVRTPTKKARARQAALQAAAASKAKWRPPPPGIGAQEAKRLAEQKKLLLKLGGKASFGPKVPAKKPKPK